MKKYFDAVLVVPLEEEFEQVLEQFEFRENLSNDRQLMFAVGVPDRDLEILLAKQSAMGRTSNGEALFNCLEIADAGIVVCVGIAGALSSDLAIGDVCYTGSVIDVLDNAKISESEQGKQDFALSPTSYSTPREITIALSLDRLLPASKPGHDSWAAEREQEGRRLVPGEFHGKDGKLETVAKPVAREGAIACGLVSGSPEYNRKLKAIDRKILAIETESGALFAAAQGRGIPALTVRGISDYAGVDKNRFEAETNNNARKIAAVNAATYLVRQLGSEQIGRFLSKRRSQATQDDRQLDLPGTEGGGDLFNSLVELGEGFNSKLRELAPAHPLQEKGYRLPVPRVRRMDTRMVGPKIKDGEPVEVREILKHSRVVTVHVPREYPDATLAWIIASDLLSAEFGNRTALPLVVEGSAVRPNRSLADLVGRKLADLSASPEVQPVFIIDEFNFESKTRVRALRGEIEARPNAYFVILTRTRANVLIESDFTRSIASCTANVCDVSFLEISYFLQKNFSLDAAASEVIAIRLRETFRKYALSAHPSYFAGIPRNTLNALLQVNRRAELIELAVAGYLSFVVSEDEEPIRLSRTTREKFLAEVSLLINVEGRSFTEAELTAYAEEFSKKYDFQISPARFVALFIEKGILHVEDGRVRFTLPFVESFLLAKRLTESVGAAACYFAIGNDNFDHRTFALYAELGASDEIVAGIDAGLDACIHKMAEASPGKAILLDPSVYPAMLGRQDRLHALQKRLQRAVDDVEAERDQSKEKQALLDASDRVREEAGSEAEKGNPGLVFSMQQGGAVDPVAVWAIAVDLLGSGAERLEGKVKRALVKKVVKLSFFILDAWTKAHHAIDFAGIRAKVLDDQSILADFAKDSGAGDIDEAKKTLSYMVDFYELVFMLMPFSSVVARLCEEARDNVLAESISNTDVPDGIESLILNLWLSDIDVPAGRKRLLASIKALPKLPLLRHAVAGHIMSRVYWRHWRKADRLDLLDAASESLKGAGLTHDKAQLKRIIENLPDTEDLSS